MDVRGKTIIADYLVLVSGTTDRHVKSISEGIIYDIKEMGILPSRKDGASEQGWIVLDYADTIIHVFHAEERQHYNLEQLYEGAALISPTKSIIDLTLKNDVSYNNDVFQGLHVNIHESDDKE